MFKSLFIRQARLNGSGLSEGDYEKVVVEDFCMTHANRPDDAVSDDPEIPPAKRTFRGNATPAGACFENTGALSNTTVASGSDNKDLACGDTILLVGVPKEGATGQKENVEKTVTDDCSACKTKAQLDSYTTNTSCLEVGDVAAGRLPTIELLLPR